MKHCDCFWSSPQDKLQCKRIQVIVIGSPGSGKKSLVKALMCGLQKLIFKAENQDFDAKIIPGKDFARINMLEDCKMAQVLIICCDWSRPDSLREIAELIKISDRLEIQRIVVGTKQDLGSAYTEQDIRDIVKKRAKCDRDLHLIITSAKTKIGIKEVKDILLFGEVQKDIEFGLRGFIQNQNTIIDLNKIKKRLLKELQNQYNTLFQEQFEGSYYYPVEIDHWKAFINGPIDSPYETGGFLLDLIFTKNYPFEPPVIKFDTMIYHPNVENDLICKDFLANWTPVMNVRLILLMIQTMLYTINDLDRMQAQDWTEKFALKRKEQGDIDEIRIEVKESFQPLLDIKFNN